jgi:antitoxin component of RelBE/YafQ-DinJ toxin-antitoxin module
LHRFVWDVRYERPAVNGFNYPMTATYLNTPRTPLGSWVLPGKYSVRLTVDGKSQTQPLTVKIDPRVKSSSADLKLMYDTSRAIDVMLRRVAKAEGEIRAVPVKSAQITDLGQRLSRASAPLSQLFGAVESTDAAPMPVVLEAWKATSAAVDAVLAEWEKMKAGPR